MSFLIVLGIWLIGAFFIIVVMKCGFHEYLSRMDDEVLPIVFTIVWPIAIPIFILIWTVKAIYKTGDTLTSSIAKKIRQKVLRKD